MQNRLPNRYDLAPATVAMDVRRISLDWQMVMGEKGEKGDRGRKVMWRARIPHLGDCLVELSFSHPLLGWVEAGRKAARLPLSERRWHPDSSNRPGWMLWLYGASTDAHLVLEMDEGRTPPPSIEAVYAYVSGPVPSEAHIRRWRHCRTTVQPKLYDRAGIPGDIVPQTANYFRFANPARL